MTKKRAISLIEKVNELFKSLFPDGWIDSLEWSDEEKSRKSFFLGKGKISDAESKLWGFCIIPWIKMLNYTSISTKLS